MTPAGPLSPCRILIVHADRVMAVTLASALGHRGGKIVGVHTHAEPALHALSFHALAHHSDLLAIVDSHVEGARSIAEALAGRGIPYLLIADVDDGAREDLCAAAVLSAPVPREDLMGAVVALCRALGHA